MYATVPQQQIVHRRVNRGRVTNGRSLALPSQRAPLSGDGLGDFLDILKNFGSGTVKLLTAGIYDPNKNRFYVPFSGGQVRNAMQGFTNFSTLGLVNTDKFFNSNTMRTVGNIGAGIEAAAVATIGAGALTGTMGFGASGATTAGAGAVAPAGSSAVPTSTSLLSNPTLQTANIARMTGSAVPSVAVPSSTGLFATSPITGAFASVPAAGTPLLGASAPSLLSQIGSGISSAFSTLGKALTTGSQLLTAAKPIMGAVTGGGGVAPQDAGSGQMMPGGAPIIIAGPGTQVGVPLPNGGYGFLPASYGDFSGGTPMMPGGGGGGMMLPTGPEGAQEMANMAVEGDNSQTIGMIAIGGVVLLAYLYWR